ncbi:LysR family transcriptional regulator [Actinoplanes sp. LDG1-06]|uniref:LysR family transcriptional regulator n=1 Tax=Paractinoplanes ovalisporus TaxID=2810368 RepID=A0ABS2A4T4_9ACTN|nr:LysR substrate-binding domain-containing protein [Actinoplanes ovalisporus]MBM2614303.1 LysR family transcriptional regulator [Actinoplanes ovalisporus]
MDAHLRDLRYFLAVAEHLHFTRAAEALFVSQPALSKQIRALEKQLRVSLFERDHRDVRLTTAGAALVPHARAVLEAWQSAERALVAAASTLVVGMSTAPGRGLLPAVRARLGSGVSLHLRQIPWSDPTGGLAGDEADAAFVWLPLPSPSRYRWLPVATEPRLVALPAAHRLAGRERVDLADLADEPFLTLPAAAGPLRDFWLALDERAGRPVVVGAEIANTEEAVEAVAAGLGVCLIAAGNTSLVARDGVVVRPVDGLAPSRLVLAWRRDDRRPLLATLVEAVRGLVRAGASGPEGRSG